MQPVQAEKVIHKDAEHSILVGDKERTNVEMNEYYSDEEEGSAKYKWWLWAAILGAVAIGAIVLYVVQNGINGLASKSLF